MFLFCSSCRVVNKAPPSTRLRIAFADGFYRAARFVDLRLDDKARLDMISIIETEVRAAFMRVAAIEMTREVNSPPPAADQLQSTGPIDILPFEVERWTADEMHVEQVLARANQVYLARAAYEAAVEHYPKARLMLRHGIMVIDKNR